MSIEWTLYWIEVLGNVKASCILISIFSFLISAFGLVVYLDKGDNYGDKLVYYWSKKLLIVLLVSLPLNLIIPSQQTMYMIMGVHYLKGSDIPVKVHALINKKLDEFLEVKK